MVDIYLQGAVNIYLKTYNEHISVTKPKCMAKNLIWGGMFIDFENKVSSLNHETGSRIEMEFIERKSNAQGPIVTGKVFNKEGEEVLEIGGSWRDEIYLIDPKTKVKETVWQESEHLPNANLQFYFQKGTILLNHKSDEMVGVIAPTDSRFRMDERLYEEGKIDEADKEKVHIEEQQRKTKKEIDDGVRGPWECKFFKEIEHPILKKSDNLNTLEETPIMWQLVEGEQGYWARRNRGDWADMPSLWGPFEEKKE